ncbi:alpha,alpha-trehalase ath1 [Aspergillus wentii]|nr:alpha,alpha-trehalase ath1 [Aspergillus wentii]
MKSNILDWTLLSLLLQFPAVNGSPNGQNRIARSLKQYGGDGKITADADSKNVYTTKFPGVTWDEDNWLLTTTSLDQGHYQSRGSIANGYLGINVANVGPFFELDDPVNGDVINGWPLFSRRQTFATIAGFFDSQPTTNGSNFPWLSQYGGDSVISGIPHWSGLILDLGDGTYLDSTVDGKTITNFQSTYDFKAGVLSWSYKWVPEGDKGSYDIAYRLFAHKLNINQAVVDLEIVPSSNANASIVNLIDGYSAVRTDFVQSGQDDGAIFSSVRPWGISNVTAYVYANLTGSENVDLSSRKIVSDKPYVNSNESTIAQSVNVKFSANEKLRITKFVGAASTDAFANPRKTAKRAVSAGMTRGYTQSLQSHVSEWASIMTDNSVDKFANPETGVLPADSHIVDSAIIAVANTYYLLQNTVGKNAANAVSGAPVNVDSLSVGGLTSDSYAGQVFWDADIWMQPGLVASHPEASQRFTNYRVAQYAQAMKNIEAAFASSRNETNFSPSAAAYPWTSGRFGNCTATGPCWDYEYHLNGDIGLSTINQWVASGDTQYFHDKHLPVYDSIATLYSNLLERNGSSWTLRNMTDPDEYANHVDAGGFTMPLIAQTLTYANSFRKQFGIETNETWTEMAENILLLRESDITLEFTTMNGSTVVKQADVVLNTYPLDYSSNYTAQNSLNDLDYYANKQSSDGPGMTWAIFSIVANDVSESGCSAYTYQQYSYEPYARAPFFQLSEQMVDDYSSNGGTHPAYPFLTGSGGANQVVLFGYLGLRLLPDDVIHINPNLPPQIPHITYRTFYWRGWPMSASSNYTHTTIRRAANVLSLDTADLRFANVSIPVHVGTESNTTVYKLPVKGALTVRNRQIGSKNTIPGNLVQCRPVYSPSEYEPGQFPISAVDGATSTKWQPSSANLSSVTVSFADSEINKKAVGFYFDWAQSPPVNATIIFHDNLIEDPALTLMSENNSNYIVVSSMKNITQSSPYDQNTNLDKVVIPTGNTTRTELHEPVRVTRYATLLIYGNQALEGEENAVGATVAEWAILEQPQSSGQSENGSTKRKLQLKDAALMSDNVTRRRKFIIPN